MGVSQSPTLFPKDPVSSGRSSSPRGAPPVGRVSWTLALTTLCLPLAEALSLDLPGVDWRALQRVTVTRTAEILRRWMGEVADGTYVYTERSGHLIQRDEPELVVWAIRRVLDASERARMRRRCGRRPTQFDGRRTAA